MVMISAHRGGSEAARPATYEAYQDALASGAEYAEFDIRKTGDGFPVVYHDARAGQAGPAVSEVTYRELCDLAGYRVPRVLEVMRLLAGRVRGHLDLKEAGYEAEIVSAATDVLGAGNFLVTTLEDASAKAIKQAFPEVKTALSLGRGLRELPRSQWAGTRRGELFPLPRLRASGADGAAVNHRLGQLGVIRACRRGGFWVMVWTVDADGLIDRFLRDERVDVLITNRPRYAAGRRAALAAAAGGASPAASLGRD